MAMSYSSSPAPAPTTASLVGEEKQVVIVGGGICGLATALGLHRKGVSGVLVLEKAESLRTTGSAIGLYTNGWRALDELGVGDQLRRKAVSIDCLRYVSMKYDTQGETPMGNGELRCVKRRDLMDILADSLPPGTLRFGCNTLAVEVNPVTSLPVVRMDDGSVIKSKVVIGCDGINSIVSEYLQLKATRVFSTCGVRGFTHYPSGHKSGNVFKQMMDGRLIQGSVPVDDNLLHWFAGWPVTAAEAKIYRDPNLVREAAIEKFKDTPKQVLDMIRNTDPDSLTLSQLRYRAPWDMLLGTFRKGMVTVAGDAMHAMGPFLGQGGSSSLEDAIVLARNLGGVLGDSGSEGKLFEHDNKMQERVGAALDKYIRQRRLRLFRLLMQTYLMGMTLEASSPVLKFVAIFFLVVFFGVSIEHTRYNCGHL